MGNKLMGNFRNVAIRFTGPRNVSSKVDCKKTVTRSQDEVPKRIESSSTGNCENADENKDKLHCSENRLLIDNLGNITSEKQQTVCPLENYRSMSIYL